MRGGGGVEGSWRRVVESRYQAVLVIIGTTIPRKRHDHVASMPYDLVIHILIQGEQHNTKTFCFSNFLFATESVRDL